MGPAARKLLVEITPGSDPISGRVADEHGSHPFTGWLQLATALEALAAPVDEEGAEENSESQI